MLTRSAASLGDPLRDVGGLGADTVFGGDGPRCIVHRITEFIPDHLGT